MDIHWCLSWFDDTKGFCWDPLTVSHTCLFLMLPCAEGAFVLPVRRSHLTSVYSLRLPYLNGPCQQAGPQGAAEGVRNTNCPASAKHSLNSSICHGLREESGRERERKKKAAPETTA